MGKDIHGLPILPGALARPGFETGEVLTARELTAEQAWRRQRFRRHNRHLHGWGVICGLRVVPALDAASPWRLLVCPGYALGPHGDEILVTCAVVVELRDALWARPSPATREAFVAIRHVDTAGVPRAEAGASCGCDDRRMVTSRVSDGARVDVLWQAPELAAPPAFDLCADLPACAPCPVHPHVLLARVRVPADETVRITLADIEVA